MSLSRNSNPLLLLRLYSSVSHLAKSKLNSISMSLRQRHYLFDTRVSLRFHSTCGEFLSLICKQHKLGYLFDTRGSLRFYFTCGELSNLICKQHKLNDVRAHLAIRPNIFQRSSLFVSCDAQVIICFTNEPLFLVFGNSQKPLITILSIQDS